MDVIAAIRSRKSVRGFKSDPIPDGILKEILDIALRSPSTMNTQPWGVMVVTGKALEDIKRGNIEALKAGQTPQGELPLRPFAGDYRQRQVDLAIGLFKLMGIGREDKDKRAAWSERGYRFFDAPAGLVLTMEKALDGSPMSLLDMGALMQSICLTALNYGLATCIEDQSIMFPHVVRKVTGLPESRKMVIAIAIGYPDPAFPANAISTARETSDKVVTWHRN